MVEIWWSSDKNKLSHLFGIPVQYQIKFLSYYTIYLASVMSITFIDEEWSQPLMNAFQY